MSTKSMTAMVSCFSRAYHTRNYKEGAFKDDLAIKMFDKNEYENIGLHMSQGISFFNPEFKGDNNQSLRWIVDNYLSPSPVVRAVFCENALENAVLMGAKQYVILASGYDTFAYRNSEVAKQIKIFELDMKEVIKDKKERLKKANIEVPKNVTFISADLSCKDWIEKLLSSKQFSKDEITFCSLLGLSYYLTKESLKKVFTLLSDILPDGSSIVFDYPDENTYTENAGIRTKKQLMLAQEASEGMKASYSYKEMENLLSSCGFLVYEHLNPDEITNSIFKSYNEKNPNNMIKAFDNVNYCLVVKK